MVEAELPGERGRVVDVGSPGYRCGIVGPRLAAATLVVKDELVVSGEVEHLRQQVLVICAGSAVENEQFSGSGRAVFAPIQGDWGSRCEAGFPRRRDRRHIGLRISLLSVKVADEEYRGGIAG